MRISAKVDYAVRAAVELGPAKDETEAWLAATTMLNGS